MRVFGVYVPRVFCAVREFTVSLDSNDLVVVVKE